MTTLSPNQSDTSSFGKRLRSQLNKGQLWLIMYILIAPTLISMAVFGYYPKIEVFRFAFYEWNPGQVEEFTGFKNIAKAFSDKMFWQSFSVVMILLVANLFKMWPSIFTAIVLHRLKNDSMRYIYQVLFVIPMVVPGLVWLLIWKSFYEPNTGILNKFLRMTYMMDILQSFNGFMPKVSAFVVKMEHYTLDWMFGSVWGLVILGGAVLMATGDWKEMKRRWILWVLLLPAAIFLWGVFVADAKGAMVFSFVGVIRVFVLLGAVMALKVLVSNLDQLTRDSIINWAGVGILGLAFLFVLGGHVWPEEVKAFADGRPNWLGQRDLIIPAVIMWGFPWVGIVGVMIYLAGLQNISEDVYEAAELDGVGPIGKLFQIELPLMMTMVRINLIFMTMGTLTGYGFFLILLGTGGGPDGAGMVPGLYMFNRAFLEGEFGYACMLGLVMFFMILILTVIYQKYVKVEK